MADSFYSYLAFIQPTSNADIIVLKRLLAEFYSTQTLEDTPIISLVDDKITLTFSDNYRFFIHLSDEIHVIVEAKEFAQENSLDWNEEPFDKKKLETSNKRFEISGDDDFDMGRFKDSLFILHVIERFTGIIIFNGS